jgi:translocation and assembly module TamB
MGGEIEIRGINRNFTITTDLDTLQFTLFDRTVINEGPIVLRYEDNRVNIDKVKLKSGPAVLQLTGYFTPGREVQITVYGTTYLAPLKPLFQRLEYLRGYSEFVFSITGEWSSPLINGGISLEDASLEFKGMPGRITGINGYAYVDENRLVVEEITGRFSGGSFVIKGGGRIKGISLKKYTFELSTENITFKPFKGLSADISSEFLVTESENEIFITGDVKILRASFTRNIDWRQILLGRQRHIVLAKNEILKRISLTVSIYGEDNIVIDNNIMSAPARVDLVLTGTVYSPTLLGRIELLGGKVFFRNNQFTVINASADFTEPEELNPYIDITARTSVKGYNITLMLNGYANEFNLSLSSEPSLDEVDILSLLTVGSLSSGIKGLEGGIGASEATMFITGKLQETLQERLRSLTGFDRIELEPSVVETTGTLGPRVTVYKRLLSDRLYVTYTTTIGTETEQLLRLEFQLSDKISLVGERDELGLVGGDIKFRLEFR